MKRFVLQQTAMYLPAQRRIIIDCWTGGHLSQVTTYLNRLGHEAESSKFDYNNLFYDCLATHRRVGSAQSDFPLVPTAP